MSRLLTVFAALVLLATATALRAQTPQIVSVETADGGRYSGPLVNGKFHGRGEHRWPNGALYEGEFRNGFYHGQGRRREANGDVFEGHFVDGVVSGKGRLKTSAGHTYVGEFRDDVYDGHGRFDDGNGNVYVGRFRHGNFHGQGRLTATTYRYSGSFRRGSFWGRGELRFSDGRVYRGDFVRNRMHGKGRLEASGQVYEGDFRDDAFTGKGVFTDRDGMRQEGEFSNFLADGHSKITAANGMTYEGRFTAGNLVGDAQLTTPNGDRYHGETSNWLPHGKGELRRANGDVYTGYLAYGVPDGEGTLVYAQPQADGRTKDVGTWRRGELVQREQEELEKTRQSAEQALYAQQGLLDEALKAIKERDPSAINMYLLAVGGDGSQEVFRREVEYVRKQFDESFGTRGRSVALINSRSTAGTLPLATLRSVRQSLASLARRMDKQRDILFVFVTSHGSAERELSLAPVGIAVAPLKASDLATALKETGVRWKVVVLSACYAGGFIEDLKDPTTLIIAAARHDRRSFGCADENDFTYFGRAFFKEALPHNTSFDAAFKQAEALITEWEERDARSPQTARASSAQEATDRHSLPQIESPEAIRAHLSDWWAQTRAADQQPKAD